MYAEVACQEYNKIEKYRIKEGALVIYYPEEEFIREYFLAQFIIAERIGLNENNREV